MTGKMGIGMTSKMGIGMTSKIEIENGNEKREREKTFMPEFSLRAILVPKSRNKFKMMGAMHPRIHASTQKKDRLTIYETIFSFGAGGGT